MISISFKMRTAQMVASDDIMSRGTMGAFWSLLFFIELLQVLKSSFSHPRRLEISVNPVEVQAAL